MRVFMRKNEALHVGMRCVTMVDKNNQTGHRYPRTDQRHVGPRERRAKIDRTKVRSISVETERQRRAEGSRSELTAQQQKGWLQRASGVGSACIVNPAAHGL
jgi:hypothetical protein